jgi:hypothetical protein
LFEQSTRKFKWKAYDGQAKFFDDLKGRRVIARKRGYGPQYVNLFVKLHKKKMREFARQRGIPNPIGVRLDKWGLKRRRALEEERARKEAKEEERVQMQILNDHVDALCASESLEALLFSLPAFKCNIITLLTCCISYMKGLDAPRTMPQRWSVQDLRERSYMGIEREMVIAFYLRLCCPMKGTRIRTTLLG